MEKSEICYFTELFVVFICVEMSACIICIHQTVKYGYGQDNW